MKFVFLRQIFCKISCQASKAFHKMEQTNNCGTWAADQYFCAREPFPHSQGAAFSMQP